MDKVQVNIEALSERPVMIEHFYYGMLNGKIVLFKTPGVNRLVSDRNQAILRSLGAESNGKYHWLRTEQVIAFHYIEEVSDGNGRKWVVNHTLLIPIHDYIRLTNPFEKLDSLFIKGIHNPEEIEGRVPFEVAVNG